MKKMIKTTSSSVGGAEYGFAATAEMLRITYLSNRLRTITARNAIKK